MHHQIDTILKRLRQDVAHQLDPESIRSACRQAGHRWRNRVLDPGAIVHCFVVQVLHGNTSLEHVARLRGRSLHRRGLLPGARRVAASRPPNRASRSGGGAGFHHRSRGALPRASRLPGQRLVLLHARRSRTPRSVRSARRTEAGMRLSHGQGPGVVPRRDRDAVEGRGRAAASARHGGRGRDPSLAETGRRVGRRPGVLFIRSYRDVDQRRCSGRLPDASAADRRLHAKPTTRPGRGEKRGQGPAPVALAARSRSA